MKKKNVDTVNKNNKKFVIIIGVISFLVIIAFILTFLIMTTNKEKLLKYEREMTNIKEQNSSAIIDYKEVIEYKTEWTYEDLLNNLIDENKLSDKTNIKITVNDDELNNSSILRFDTAGSYKIVIYLNKEYNYKIIKEYNKEITVIKEIVLNVEDTIYPVIEGVSNKTITVGDKIELLSGISATDEIEGEIEVQVEGEVDTSKAGTYTIKVYAVDANGNRTDAEYTVTVEEKIVTSSGSNKTSSSTSSSNTNKNNNNNNNSNSNSNNNNNNSNGCSFSSLLKKRGYKNSDTDACEKDKQASVVAKKIANSILAKGYTTDLEKVSAAAKQVSAYYVRENHTETGLDYQTPYGVFILRASSCAGTTRALMQVLEYMGYTI